MAKKILATIFSFSVLTLSVCLADTLVPCGQTAGSKYSKVTAWHPTSMRLATKAVFTGGAGKTTCVYVKSGLTSKGDCANTSHKTATAILDMNQSYGHYHSYIDAIE